MIYVYPIDIYLYLLDDISILELNQTSINIILIHDKYFQIIAQNKNGNKKVLHLPRELFT